MVKVLVVGGGYWGSSIAYEARAADHNVVHIDSGDKWAASRNASAICDPNAYHSSVFERYWPEGWTGSELLESFDWLVKRGGKVTQEYFWNKFAGSSPRKAGQSIYLDDNSVITSLSFYRVGRLSGFVETYSSIVATVKLGGANGDFYHTWDVDYLVLACGYSTDDALRSGGIPPMGVQPLYGRGLIVGGYPSQHVNLPISVMIRPYCKHTVREWGVRYRVGDTAEGSKRAKTFHEDKAMKDLDTVRTAVLNDVLGDSERVVVEGYRPVLDKFTVTKVRPRVIVATGGHRLGLGLSGLVAKKVTEMLK